MNSVSIAPACHCRYELPQSENNTAQVIWSIPRSVKVVAGVAIVTAALTVTIGLVVASYYSAAIAIGAVIGVLGLPLTESYWGIPKLT